MMTGNIKSWTSERWCHKCATLKHNPHITTEYHCRLLAKHHPIYNHHHPSAQVADALLVNVAKINGSNNSAWKLTKRKSNGWSDRSW